VTLVGSRDAYEKVTRMGIKNALRGEFLGIDLGMYEGELREQNFFRKKYGLGDIDGKVKLAIVGRLTPDKGWRFLLKTLVGMNPEQIAIVIVGDGEMRREIGDRLGNLAHFVGRIAPEEVPAVLVNCDVLVTASEKETRGLTILEGFAAGLAAIAPNAGGVTDSVEDGVNGFLFEPGNEADFIEKVNRLVDDAGMRREMGLRGREGVQGYDWEKMVGNLVKIWEREIERKRR
jgi:glycosyltransferase involved in cell wall biosynthesis